MEEDVGGIGDVVMSDGDSFVGRRYRWDEDIAVRRKANRIGRSIKLQYAS